MKKVLLGLVITLMINSNVYADLGQDYCSYLKNSVKEYIFSGKIYYDLWSDALDNNDNSDNSPTLENYVQKELNEIKKAHYFAVTYSALCD